MPGATIGLGREVDSRDKSDAYRNEWFVIFKEELIGGWFARWRNW